MLDPDVTGDYEPIGPWNDKPSYELVGNGWFIWFGPPGIWYISAERGNIDPPSWDGGVEDPPEVYAPNAPATGNATVAEI